MSIENDDNKEPKPDTPQNLSGQESEENKTPVTEPTQEPVAEPKDPNLEKAAEIRKKVNLIKSEIGKVIIGQGEMMEMMVAALITNGHILIEGVPGIAKTLTSKLLAKSISVDFSRIQFTPDLMPSDILGTTIFDMKQSEFYFKKGPIFNNIILIDEINRAPAKTQAALMEVMEEEQVTIDGKSYIMEKPFFVIATQNPVEQEGTYKLPEAQLDRFMFKLESDYPNADEEVSMLMRFKEDFYGKKAESVSAAVDAGFLKEARDLVEKVYIKDDLVKYIAEIVGQTRNNSDLYLGASPRASLNILKAAKAVALLTGRMFVTPDDIKKVLYPILNHRLILSYEREIEGIPKKDIIEAIVRKVEIPR